MTTTAVTTFGPTLLAIFGVGLVADLWWNNSEDILTDWVGLLVLLTMSVGRLRMFHQMSIRKDFSTYTHYPICFNRKTRQVHVFGHNGPDGVLTLPWEEVFFHVGIGTDEESCATCAAT